MKIERLYPLERLYLRLCAEKDVKREVFRQSKGSFTEHGNQRSETADLRPDNESAEKTVREYVSVSSPFINMELSKYEDFREHFLGRRRIISWTVNHELNRCLRFATFSDTMSDLDRRINVISTDISILASEYEDRIEEWNQKRVEYENQKEWHLVQLCTNRIIRLRQEYYSRAAKKYSGVINLLGEKLRILNKTEGQLLAYRGRYFLRIRYYYQYASNASPNLPVNYFGDEVLTGMANMDTLTTFDSVRNDTQEKLERFVADVAAFTRKT